MFVRTDLSKLRTYQESLLVTGRMGERVLKERPSISKRTLESSSMTASILRVPLSKDT